MTTPTQLSLSSNRAFRISALFGFAAVVLGAFGAHGLKHLFEEHNTRSIWETATLYHLAHAIVLLTLSATMTAPSWAWRCFAVGVAIFSGSLYLLAVTNWRWLGAITPLGGLFLLAGWLLLAVRGKS